MEAKEIKVKVKKFGAVAVTDGDGARRVFSRGTWTIKDGPDVRRMIDAGSLELIEDLEADEIESTAEDDDVKDPGKKDATEKDSTAEDDDVKYAAKKDATPAAPTRKKPGPKPGTGKKPPVKKKAEIKVEETPEEVESPGIFDQE